MANNRTGRYSALEIPINQAILLFLYVWNEHFATATDKTNKRLVILYVFYIKATSHIENSHLIQLFSTGVDSDRFSTHYDKQ